VRLTLYTALDTENVIAGLYCFAKSLSQTEVFSILII
jgi:hypothetical protein